MKKVLMITAILFMGMLSMSGQTYCYKHLYNVDTNGVRQKVKTHYIYITFVNNFNTCYMSDQFGNADGNGQACQYKGKDRNGTLIYEDPVEEYGFGLSNRGMRTTRYFSSDLSRMNFKNELMNNIIGVYEKVSAPKDEDAPVELY